MASPQAGAGGDELGASDARLRARVVEDHQRACGGFSAVVEIAGEHWSAPSPCGDWDARGVLEHVIGFHDVLLLRPLEAKPVRPKDDPEARWAITVEALFSALAAPEAITAERESLLAYLATEMLVHTWDLAKAIGVEVALDPRLCQVGFDRTSASAQRLGPDMFGPAVAVPQDAPVQDRLIGLFGRDPGWTGSPR